MSDAGHENEDLLTITMHCKGLKYLNLSKCNKLTDKQRKIFRVREDWDIISSLDALGIKKEDISYVILTHLDFDHAGGITMQEEDRLSLTFPKAKHIIQRQLLLIKKNQKHCLRKPYIDAQRPQSAMKNASRNG